MRFTKTFGKETDICTTGLIAGKSNVGKTSLFNTIETENKLFIDINKGTAAIKNASGHRIDIESYQDLLNLAVVLTGYKEGLEIESRNEYTKAHYKKALDIFKQADFLSVLEKVEFIYIDALGDIAELAFTKFDNKEVRLTKINDNKKLNKLKVYDDMADSVIHLLKRFKMIHDKDVWFVSLLDEEKLDDRDRDSKSHYTFQVKGRKLKTNVEGLFDHILVLGKATNQARNVLYSTPYNIFNFEGKDRSNTLLPVEQANLNDVIDKIKAGKILEERELYDRDDLNPEDDPKNLLATNTKHKW